MSERWLAVFYRATAMPAPDARNVDAEPELPAATSETEWLGWDAWVLPDGLKQGPARR